MPNALQSIVDGIKADPGLKASIPDSKIQKGIDAAHLLNSVLLQMIAQTGVNKDGRITASDMQTVSDALWTDANAAAWRDFWLGHGNDNGDVVSGFHHVQDDGGTLMFQGRNFIDTVADAIYHYGFRIKNGRYFNEDGNANETTRSVAGWLNFFLNGENLVLGTGGNDEQGSGKYSNYFAKARNETFLAGDGNDKIWADIGHDRVFGGDGNDKSGGGTGNDRMFGEAGRDTLWGDEGADRLYGGAGDDELGGGDHGDRIYGDAGTDRIYGGGGADWLEGGEGRDNLMGEKGNDRLYGGAWADKLMSGEGADWVVGGAGADEIYLWEKRKAQDVLVFQNGDCGTAVEDRDYVEGFQPGTDKIDLRSFEGMTFAGLDFVGNGKASCRFTDGILLIDADGDRSTDMAITFKYVDRLDAKDFLFA